MPNNVIRNIKDVHAVASKMFKCGAKRLDDIHAKGYLGVKLIVGHKLNPAFDANADPNKSGLTPEERVLEEHKANPRVADVRILWVRPGTTIPELTKEFLVGIKKSLETKTPIIDKDITGLDSMLKKEGKTDAEMASDVAKGKSSFEKADPDDDIDEIGFDDEVGSPEGDQGLVNDENDGCDQSEEQENSDSEVLEAIKALNSNVETLSGDINKVNDAVGSLEGRLDDIENKPKTKKKK